MSFPPDPESLPTTLLTINDGPEEGLKVLFTAYLGDSTVVLKAPGEEREFVGTVIGIGQKDRRSLKVHFEDDYFDRLTYCGKLLRDTAEAFYLGTSEKAEARVRA